VTATGEKLSIWNTFKGVPHTLHWAQAGAWHTRVLEAGDRRAEALVLMHGTGGHLEAYTHNIARLAERYRVIAYDFPGHGYTTHAEADLELDTYVEHLADLLDALGIQKAHLSGESLGGWVAIKFAAAHPERVAKTVLNTPGGTMASPEVMERIRSLSQAAADDPSPEQVRARLEWLMADPATVTDELVDVRRTLYARPGYPTSARHILCLQDPEIRRRNMVTGDDLAAVPGPTLVIWTSDDPSGPAKAGMDMAEKIPDARFEVIAGAGHWPQWEQAEQFTDLVLEFLKG
jgi:2-hydroxy-6-oxonona-2,4-dienedioate hydrolase